MPRHRQKPKRRKRAGAIAAVLTVGAVGIPVAAQASGVGPKSWNIASFDWWGWGEKSRPVATGTPSSSAFASATALSSAAATAAAPASTPSEPSTSASPSPSASPKASRTPTTAPATTPPVTPSSLPKVPAVSGTPRAAAASADPGPTDQVLTLVNAERAKAGCSPLTENAKLTKAAQDHSQDMADHQNMSHTGSDGSSMADRLTRVGYAFRTAGENVAYGYSSPESVMDGWMNSPGHKANILNCAFKEIGIGLAQPGFYWTQDFGATS
ncbi:CAP domain-containing protein [Streptomyces griseorubiginosus]|uniref:CAP domain-containing protein n=1 Tax=Streptomyces griseorubiginosus TaxID=67304 RepID=UPI0033AE7AB5